MLQLAATATILENVSAHATLEDTFDCDCTIVTSQVSNPTDVTIIEFTNIIANTVDFTDVRLSGKTILDVQLDYQPLVPIISYSRINASTIRIIDAFLIPKGGEYLKILCQ